MNEILDHNEKFSDLKKTLEWNWGHKHWKSGRMGPNLALFR